MDNDNKYDVATPQRAAVTDDLAATIELIVVSRRSVTLPELREHLGPVFDGDRRLCDATDANSIFWTNVSRVVGDALSLLVSEERVEIRVVSSGMHLLSAGSVLDLPPGRRTPKGGYKHPRWLPMFLEASGSSRRRVAAWRKYQRKQRCRRMSW